VACETDVARFQFRTPRGVRNGHLPPSAAAFAAASAAATNSYRITLKQVPGPVRIAGKLLSLRWFALEITINKKIEAKHRR
jgi:hypothetical protein